MQHTEQFFAEVAEVASRIDKAAISRLADALAGLRSAGGRLFLLGVGGSAGNCSHAVNDFRKLCGIEAYIPGDNVSELTARTNDEGWETVFAGWLETSRLGAEGRDPDLLRRRRRCGARRQRQYRQGHRPRQGARRQGVRHRRPRNRPYGARRATSWSSSPRSIRKHITPLSEAFQAVVWHCLVSNPVLQSRETKW